MQRFQKLQPGITVCTISCYSTPLKAVDWSINKNLFNMSIKLLNLQFKQLARCRIQNEFCMYRNLNWYRNFSQNVKKSHPSADRNSKPISEAILAQVDRQTPNLQLLEVASGSGQHAGFLAPLVPNITFQPTEFERYHFPSIRAYAAECTTQNIRQPLFVDISQDLEDWEPTTTMQVRPASYDYIFNSNMMHISPWSCSVGLFQAAGKLLKPGGVMYTYGPYATDGVLTPQSNVHFDAGLRRQNSDWGVRDIVDLKALGKENGLELQRIVDMPSNNKFLTWLKL